MAASRQLYTGDGVQKQYNIPFPFIDIAHVQIIVDNTLQLTPMHYSISGVTITFVIAPEDQSAIAVERHTSPSNILVDFHDGSTLGENELDTAYLHNFYLSQEYADSFNALINNAFLQLASDLGIVEESTDDIITALVTEMLTQAAAATLQQRVADIDLNAEAILDLSSGLQIQINTLAQGVAAVVYVQPGEPIPGVDGIPDPIVDGARWYDSDDNNKPYIYDQTGTVWLSLEDPRVGQAVADITVLQTDVDDNAAAVVTEQTARSDADTAFASLLALIGAQNGAQTAFIIDTATVKIDSDAGDTFAARFTSLSAADSDNSASISSEQSARISADEVSADLFTLLGAENVGQTAFILNEDTVKIASDGGDTLAERFAALVAASATNAASVSTEQTARISADDSQVSNISANASSITDLEATIDLRARTFFQSSAPTADNIGDLWIDADDDVLHRWSGTVWEPINDAAIAANASAITSLTTDVESNDGDISANVSSISTLDAEITTVDGRVDSANVNIATNVSAISNSETDITDLYAHYGVTLDVNGYITGFSLNNDGQTGAFVIVADKFAIVTPNTPWTATASKSIGDMVRPTTPNSRVFKCTTAGTTGSSEPTWDTVVGNDTTDNDIVWETVDDVPVIPFLLQDGVVKIQDLEISGTLIVDGTLQGVALVAGTIGQTQIGANAITTGKLNANAVTAVKIAANTITADKMSVSDLAAITADIGAITAGSIVLDNSGFIRGGQSAYNTGDGFFLGYDTADYKFSLGDGGIDNFITWDGTSLVIRGNVSIGQYDASNNIMLSADTERTTTVEMAWQEKKSFSLNRPGTVRITFDVKMGNLVGGLVTAGEYRVKRDGTIVASGTFNTTSYVGKSHDITMLTGSAGLTVDIKGGLRNTPDPVDSPSSIQNCRIKADKSDGESVLID